MVRILHELNTCLEATAPRAVHGQIVAPRHVDIESAAVDGAQFELKIVCNVQPQPFMREVLRRHVQYATPNPTVGRSRLNPENEFLVLELPPLQGDADPTTCTARARESTSACTSTKLRYYCCHSPSIRRRKGPSIIPSISINRQAPRHSGVPLLRPHQPTSARTHAIS